jgi:hypothetical protein
MCIMILAAGFLGMDRQTWLSIAIGAIVSLVLSVLFYRLQKMPKTLDYAIHSILDLSAKTSPYLQAHMVVMWHENQRVEAHPLKDPRIVDYRIRNTGKRAIDADDFKNPIEVKTSEGSVVDVLVTRVSHEGVLRLGSILSSSHEVGVFTPTLMNPGDWIDIQVITEGCPEPPELTAWIREESRSMQKRQGVLDPPLREVLKRRWTQPASELMSIVFGVVSAITAIVTLLLAFLK